MPSFLREIERKLRHSLRGRNSSKAMDLRIRKLEAGLEQIRLSLAESHRQRVLALPPSSPLEEAEFKVSSQFGEDGILQFLTRHVPCPDRRFVEFGVEDFLEANCRYLLHREPWRGLVMDGDPSLEEKLRRQEIYWARDLRGRSAFITAENINQLLQEEGFTGDLSILSIDVDGNDYWIWEALEVASPRIVACEYNSVFGSSRPVVVPYRADFNRREAHYSWLYSGASLPALCHLAHRKGYAFVGSNSAGNNAFFVRRDVLGGLRELTAEQGYVESTFRESRDPKGRMTFLSGRERLAVMADMPLIDPSSNEQLVVRDLIS